MTPKDALLSLAEKARSHNFLHCPGRLSGMKPGEFLEKHATEEEKEALKNLTSEDAGVHPNCYKDRLY